MNPVAELNIKNHEYQARTLRQVRADLYIELENTKDQDKAEEIRSQISQTTNDIAFHERKVDDLLAIA